MRKIGTCKLCLEEKELCNSHIIPEFAYEYVYEKNKSGRKLNYLDLTKNNELVTKFREIGYREKLLCSKCESKLNVWETYVSKKLKKSLTNFAIENTNNLYKIAVDYKKFRLFFLSILWRCSITSNKLFKIDLGYKHTENLRDLLYNGNTGNPNQYQLLIQELIDRTDYSKTFLGLSQFPKKVSGFTTYSFLILGYKCYIFVGSQEHKLIDEIETFTLKEDNTIIIALENFKDNFEVQQISKLMKKSK